MVKVEVIEHFTLKDYKKVKPIKKQSKLLDMFLKGDIFECDNKMAEYLEGDNYKGTAFIKVIEVIPEKEEKKEPKQVPDKEPKEIVKKTRKKKTNIEK